MYAKLRYVSLIVSVVLAVALSAFAADRTSRSAGQVLNDSTIETKVKAALVADPDVKGTQVGIEVFKGVVQLSGFVDSAANAQKAGKIARNVKGVKEVRNSLQVR